MKNNTIDDRVPMYCAICFDQVRWSENALAYFHMRGGIEFGTIAREITLTPLHKPLKAVMPAPKDSTAGFTVPKISGRSVQIRIL